MRSCLFILFLVLVLGSDGYAQSWAGVGTAGFSLNQIFNPSIAIHNNVPYVAYSDQGFDYGIVVKKFNGSGWVPLASNVISSAQGASASIAIDASGVIYVAYQDDGTTKIGATVRKFSGTTWSTVGVAGFSAGQVESTTLALDTGGTPCVAYMDFGNNCKATVMKYTDTGWANVGNAGFTADSAYNPALAMDRNGTPYVVFQDAANGHKTTVMKYTDTGWAIVGMAGFSVAQADNPAIAIDTTGAPYVAYQDYGHASKVTVMKYTDTGWAVVGSAGFSAGDIYNPSLAIDGYGTVYAAYQDGGYGGKATVMKYNPTLAGWVNAGNPGFSAGNAFWTVIAVAEREAPYVVYSDYASTDKVTVMDLSPAGIAGVTNVCLDGTRVLSDATAGGNWASSNTAVATVAAGVVSGLAAGTATITYTVSGISTFVVVNVAACATAVGNVVNTAYGLAIFPNPTRGAFTLNISSAQNETARVTITNMLGEKIKEISVPTNEDNAVMLNVAAGVYFVAATTSEGKRVEKIVVE